MCNRGGFRGGPRGGEKEAENERKMERESERTGTFEMWKTRENRTKWKTLCNNTKLHNSAEAAKKGAGTEIMGIGSGKFRSEGGSSTPDSETLTLYQTMFSFILQPYST